MQTFFNQATLSYNGNTVASNIVQGELIEVLSAVKTATAESYEPGDTVTYAVSIVNSGTAPYNGITVTDDLGGYEFNGTTVYPLDFIEGSVRLFVNGVLQANPATVSGPPLVISGINVPAGGDAVLIYSATVNRFAPLGTGVSVTNTATLSGSGITTPITASEILAVSQEPALAITKSLNPTSVPENGQLTYTFVISNYGATDATATDNIVVTDTFNPILDPVTVTYNGTLWEDGTDYTYDETTGLFTTVAGQITVPAATYTQDSVTGEYIITPGTSTLTVTGTV